MSKRAIGIIIAGFFTLFIAFATRYSYGILLPYMLPSLGITKTQAGAIFSSYFITYTLFAPFFGILADRFNTRIILTVFMAVLGVGAGLMSFSSTVAQASIFFAIVGIGHSACWAPFVAVLMRWISPKRRGIIISIVDVGTTAGIAVWSIIIPMIIVNHSWTAVWMSLGITGLIVAVINFLLIKSNPDNRKNNLTTENSSKAYIPIKKTFSILFHDYKFFLIGFSYLLISFSILIPFTFLTTYATEELKMPYATATSLLVMIAASGAIGKLILGYISDITGRIKIMMLCGLLTGSGTLGIAYAHGLSALYVFTLIFGIGYGTLWSVYAASARDLFSKDYSGSIIGLWTLFHGLGSITSPILSGLIIDATGRYVWVFILSATASLLALLLLLPLWKSDVKISN